MTATLLLKSRFFSKRRYWWLPALIWIGLVSPVKAMELRVAIVEGAGQVKVGSSTPAKSSMQPDVPWVSLRPERGSTPGLAVMALPSLASNLARSRFSRKQGGCLYRRSLVPGAN